jgi:hypothetical protein
MIPFYASHTHSLSESLGDVLHLYHLMAIFRSEILTRLSSSIVKLTVVVVMFSTARTASVVFIS